MVGTARYKIVGLTHQGKMECYYRTGAPPEQLLLIRAHERGWQFATRYYPSRKGWRVFDLRQAVKVNRKAYKSGRTWDEIVSVGKSRRFLGSEDAAVMFMVAKAGEPVQEKLL